MNVGARFASAFDTTLLSNSWINCGSIDYLTCTRAPTPWPSDRAGMRDGRAVPRAVHALFHGDAPLRATHGRVPSIITWDDHENAISTRATTTWRRSVPVVPPPRTRRGTSTCPFVSTVPPDGPDYAIYRSFAHGKPLVRFPVLDIRQYPLRPTSSATSPSSHRSFGHAVQQLRHEMLSDDDASHTMLGARQAAIVAAKACRTKSRCGVE
jgi:phosphodiesterase/alkaline phosphatase D-like protein